MVKIISDQKEIGHCIEIFSRILRTMTVELDFNIRISNRGGVFVGNEDRYSRNDNFWYSRRDTEDKYFHAFGFGEPFINIICPIIAQLNFQKKGINWRTGGAFGKNRKGEYLILYRGNIGGGRPGVGITQFINNTHLQGIQVEGEGNVKTYYQVGILSNKDFPNEFLTFLIDVEHCRNVN
ncbi:MAG: hypothetical protein WCO63_05500 [Bacteroidota bacterium]